VTVHAEVDNPDGRLRPNAFGTGRIILRERPDAVVVPSEAVQTDGSTSLVFVRVSDTGFEARPVEPGLREGDLVEVSGVRPGEEVVTTGSFALKSELLRERITGGDD
jgi:cobalt-zinc-cadmium efflux system membrane fusion protein